jgi:hypothetical protein
VRIETRAGFGDQNERATLFAGEVDSIIGAAVPVIIVIWSRSTYNCYGCVSDGTLATAFVEGRLVPDAIVSPFLRAGVGAGSLAVESENPSEYGEGSEIHPVLALAAGPQLTVWHLFLRVRGTLTVTPPSRYTGLGAELGGVF